MRYAVLLWVLAMGGVAAGQATQPAVAGPSPWAQHVRRFGEALTKAEPLPAGLVDAKGHVRQFDSPDADSLDRLHARISSGSVISAHGYPHPPLAMAADLAADFKADGLVPEDRRRAMIPEDDVQMKRANATGVQWIAQTLQPAEGQPVGIIVLWRPAPRGPALAVGPAGRDELVFVLVKGEAVGKDEYRIRQIVYGDPLGKRGS